MQHRRRRCVRSSAPEKECLHFMKAILPPHIHSKQIRIPDEFIKRFGNELKSVITVTVPDGSVWEMELKKCGDDVFFCNKWEEFAEYYSLSYGCYLDFKYEGNSKFNVVIYDTSSIEICYPFKTPSTTNGESNTLCTNSASKRAKYAVNEYKTKNPFFLSKIYNGNSAYVCCNFAVKYLKLKVPFKLQNSHGGQWEVSCISNKARYSAMQISKGLRKFVKENNLSDEDTYVFELIKRKPVVVLLVTASRTPRQRKCVPSSAEKKVKELKHFKKAILPSPIHAEQIRIPDNFITRYGNELKNVATITVPDGCVWKMELKKCVDGVFFCNKWLEFSEYYSVGYGCYLSFKYEGNSKFSVIIFDATSVEICYPFKTPNGEPNTKCPSLRKRSRVEINDADELPSENQRLKNPSFTSTIKRNRLYVNVDFASKYLEPNVAVKLQNCKGEEWEVYCYCHDSSSPSAMLMARGFSKFATDNNLSEGDECEFELIKKMPVVLLLIN